MVVAPTATDDAPPVVTPQLPWQLAATLQERWCAGAPVDTQPQRGERRLAMWLDVAMLAGDRDTLDERLGPLNITTEELVALLGETDASLRCRLGEEPEWHRRFVRWWVAGRDAAAEHRLLRGQLELLEVARHVMEGAARELAARARELLRQLPAAGPVFCGVDHVVDRLLGTMPFGEVEAHTIRTLVLELNVARVEGRLDGTAPADRYRSFVSVLRDEPSALAIWEEYPVLARFVVDRLGFWIDTRMEFLEALIADLPELVGRGLLKQAPQRLDEVEFGVGDSHRCGRSVATVRFDTGRVMFKPRPLAMDVAFDGLLAWFNDQRPLHQQRQIGVLDRGQHGWAEFVDTTESTDAAGGDRYAWRLGALTALLYVLHATDFHYENALASGEHPVLVDLEALLHTDKTSGVVQIDGERDVAAEALVGSVHSIGVLPNPLLMQDKDEGMLSIDISALAGRGGQMSLMSASTWEDVSTDTMHMVSRRVEMGSERNLPTAADGTEFDLVSRSEFFVDGFRQTYQSLRSNRDALLAPDGPIAAFGSARSRLILRPTFAYARLLHDSTHPDFLRNGLDRDRSLARLAGGHDGIPHRAQMVRSEIAELWRGDIPVFTVDADSGTIRVGPTEEAVGVRHPAPLAEVTDRIRQLSDRDYAFQEWVTRSSLATTTIGDGEAYWPNWRRAREARPAAQEEVVHEALRVARRVAELALRDERAVGWVGLDLVGEKYWRLASAPMSTYTGTAGIALALDAVAAVTGDRETGELARMTFDHLARRTELLTAEMGDALRGPKLPELPIGAFSDIGGVAYALAHAAARHAGSGYAEPALGLLPVVGAFVDDDSVLDVVGGVAGTILVMLALERVAPGRGALDLAERCAKRLLATRQEAGGGAAWLTSLGDEAPLAGFSHGASGIAVALARLHQIRPDEAYVRAVRDSVRYEAGLFDEEYGNWRDLRSEGQGGGGEPLVAWCHGAAGVALARYHLLQMGTVADIAAELEVDRHRGVLTTFSTGLDKDPVYGLGTHCLCHGDIGNLLIVQTAHHPDRESQVAELLPTVWRTLLVEGRTNGWVCGVPHGIETPGLMTGIAGIAWGFARLAAPDLVPDVLSLEPPALSHVPSGSR